MLPFFLFPDILALKLLTDEVCQWLYLSHSSWKTHVQPSGVDATVAFVLKILHTFCVDYRQSSPVTVTFSSKVKLFLLSCKKKKRKKENIYLKLMAPISDSSSAELSVYKIFNCRLSNVSISTIRCCLTIQIAILLHICCSVEKELALFDMVELLFWGCFSF